jgi:diguanylate cyclase (GGDEF)-like protein/PAS domain S-box-containing protein
MQPDNAINFSPAEIYPEIFKSFFSTTRDMVMLFDLNPDNLPGPLLEVNDAACRKLGYCGGELVSLPTAALVTPATADRLSSIAARLLTKQSAWEECEFVSKTGEIIPCELAMDILRLKGQRLALGIARDISDRLELETSFQKHLIDLEDTIVKRNSELMEINRELQQEIIERSKAEQALAEKEQQLRLITDNMLDLIIQVDPNGQIRYISPSCRTMLDHAPVALSGGSFFDLIHTDDKPLVAALLEKAITFGEVVHFECRMLHADGHWLLSEGNARRITEESGLIIGAIVSCRDISHRRRIEEQLEYQAIHDPITALYNRTYFELALNRLADEACQPVGLIICDLDGLKYINDTLGHDAGDQLLVILADLIRCFEGDGRTLARIGGDEFAILLPHTDEDALTAAQACLAAAIDAYNRKSPKIPLCVSIGSASTGPAVSLANLFKQADNSMSRAKLLSQHSSRSSVVQALKLALEARDFVTEGHAARLKDLTLQLAKMCGFPDYRLTDLRLFAEFHDIGKVGIPDQILFKPGKLTAEEMTIMRGHCEIGHRIAVSAPDLEPIADWILKHHEWWNGKGYPLGLKGAKIPLECRILSIVDAYDAMTNDRPYRQALSPAIAAAEIQRCAGSQFDPELVNKFIELLGLTADRRRPEAGPA